MPSPFRFLFICRCLESLHHREAEGHQLQKFFNGDSESRPLSASCRPHKHIKHFYAPSWATTPYPPHHVQLPSQTTCIPKAYGNTKPAECCNLVCQKNLFLTPFQVLNFGLLSTTVQWGLDWHQWQTVTHLWSAWALRYISTSHNEGVKFNTL